MASVLFLDFDGVIAIPWTNPVQLYGHTAEMIKTLAAEYTLCLVSFNPTAPAELDRFGLTKYFKAIRAGLPVVKTEKGAQERIHKQIQIRDILDHELSDMKIQEMSFYDDFDHNIKWVSKSIPEVKCVFVDNARGLTWVTVRENTKKRLSCQEIPKGSDGQPDPFGVPGINPKEPLGHAIM